MIRLNALRFFVISCLLTSSLLPVGIVRAELTLLMYSEHIESVGNIDLTHCEQTTLYEGGNQIYNELLILCQALRLGGVNESIKLIPIPSQRRAKLELHQGLVLGAGFTFWSRDHEPEHTYFSSPILKRGEFKKALYTRKGNLADLTPMPLASLLQQSVLVNATWTVDVEALSCFDNRYMTGIDYPKMLRMVADDKTTMLLHNLAHTEDFSHRAMGVELHVVPGYLVALPDSLHFAISRHYRNADYYIEALERGLTILKATHRIHSAYEAVAFYNPKVRDWKVIRCTQATH